MDSPDRTARAPGAAGQPVVLIHGLWTGPWVMRWLARRLDAQGFRVELFGYRSVSGRLAAHALALARFADALPGKAVHFVGHSLGGAIIATALPRMENPRPGRVVLLGSPFCGSHAGSRLAEHPIGRRLAGSALREWITATRGEWTAGHELGVIAGSTSVGMGRFVAPGLARPNDGAVAVAETAARGARDHLVLPVSHSGMLISREVAAQVASFLRDGRFLGGAPA